MSLIPYALARPFLFGLDAETAHELTLDALARTQRTPLAWAYCTTMVEDPVALAYQIKRLFDSDVLCARLGEAAHLRALQTHDADANLQDLLDAYHAILQPKDMP